MRKPRNTIILGLILVFFLVSMFLYSQREQRVPWEERSPKIGQKVPDVMIYDNNLNQIPFSNLYKGTYLYIQWGGCTVTTLA